MSYDLRARKDERFSEKLARKDMLAAISCLPDIRPNGISGFILEIGDDTYMEIDVTLVDEEGDCVDDLIHLPDEANCVDFHIPYGFIEGLETCLAVAKKIAAGFQWELDDPQRGIIVPAPSKPWWKFW